MDEDVLALLEAQNDRITALEQIVLNQDREITFLTDELEWVKKNYNRKGPNLGTKVSIPNV